MFEEMNFSDLKVRSPGLLHLIDPGEASLAIEN